MYNVSLGCDPEFLFTNLNGKTVPAYAWLPRTGQLGNDGPLAEIRPSPALHENFVVENIRELLEKLPGILAEKKKFGPITPRAYSEWENYALGFHVHLGIPKELLEFKVPGSLEFIQNLVCCLDYFTGLPAMLLEDTNIRRLGDGPYGKVGDFRLTEHTLEYRTPGGFHLRHPTYTAGLLGLALCVAQDVVWAGEKFGWEKIKNVSDYRVWQDKYSLPKRNKVKAAFSDPTKIIAFRETTNIYRRLTEMTSFNLHKKSITSFFSLLLENRQFQSDLLKTWAVSPEGSYAQSFG